MENTYEVKTVRTYMNGWSFEPATIEDIPAMLEIEKLYFDKKIAFTKEQLEAWIGFNSNMFYVVKKDIPGKKIMEVRRILYNKRNLADII